MALLEVGALIAARYRIERFLARGGMASIWVARHVQLDTEVATWRTRPLDEQPFPYVFLDAT